MRKLFIVLIFVLSVVFAQTAMSQQAEVMSTVTQFVDSFNKGDAKTAAAACGDQTIIIDEFPPHEWHGAGACATWMNDFDADAKKNAITDGVVTLATPKHVDVSGDHAYVVVPADYAYKKAGKPMKETNSILTVVLQKGGNGWRITGWSWSKS
jgi:ketosteroid isomerase-like protein